MYSIRCVPHAGQRTGCSPSTLLMGAAAWTGPNATGMCNHSSAQAASGCRCQAVRRRATRCRGGSFCLRKARLDCRRMAVACKRPHQIKASAAGWPATYSHQKGLCHRRGAQTCLLPAPWPGLANGRLEHARNRLAACNRQLRAGTSCSKQGAAAAVAPRPGRQTCVGQAMSQLAAAAAWLHYRQIPAERRSLRPIQGSWGSWSKANASMGPGRRPSVLPLTCCAARTARAPEMPRPGRLQTPQALPPGRILASCASWEPFAVRAQPPRARVMPWHMRDTSIALAWGRPPAGSLPREHPLFLDRQTITRVI